MENSTAAKYFTECNIDTIGCTKVYYKTDAFKQLFNC